MASGQADKKRKETKDNKETAFFDITGTETEISSTEKLQLPAESRIFALTFTLIIIGNMRQGTTESTERPRIARRRLKVDAPQYTRTEIENRLGALTHELQYGNTRPREEVRKEIDEVLDLWEHAPWYTMEEINASLDRFRASMEAGEGIPHEQVVKEIDEFMKYL